MLSNLVGNARKFTDAGRVAIAVSPPPGAARERSIPLRFAVSDTGIGVAADQHAHLFAPFAQMDCKPARAAEGTGLGLAISKQLVELMGGTIGATSKLGQGSTFWFELPLTPLSGELARADLPGAAQQKPDLAGCNVLLVEDNTINRNIAVVILRDLGCEVLAVENGGRAVEVIERGRFAIVLMDWHMPVLGGIEATAIIRGVESVQGPLGRDGGRLKILALTANGLSSDRDHAKAMGFDEYLAKPYRKAVLREALVRTLGATTARG